MYNPELKNVYLNTIDNEGTRDNIGYTFQKARELEEEKGKDVSQFNFDELGELWSSFRAKSFAAITTKVSIIVKYIDFCIEKGLADVNYNWAKMYFNEDGLRPYVSKVATNNRIISRETLEDIIDFCANAQDAVVFALLFEGVKGRPIQASAFEEVRNLRMVDCNTNTNDIILRRDDGVTRVIQVSEKTMNLIADAFNQQEYIRKNGEVISNKLKELELIETGYVLKLGDIGKNTNSTDDRVSHQVILRRLKNITKAYGNSFLTPTNIYMSGMVDYAKTLQAEKGTDLDNNDYIHICEKYNIDIKRWYKIKVEIKEYL
jgi:hypothetical protein